MDTIEYIRNAWFDGVTITPELDNARLRSQSLRVFLVMVDGKWRTLREIAKITNDPESSISARLRDYRKKRFGQWQVDRRRRYVSSNGRRRGLWEYRLLQYAPLPSDFN